MYTCFEDTEDRKINYKRITRKKKKKEAAKRISLGRRKNGNRWKLGFTQRIKSDRSGKYVSTFFLFSFLKTYLKDN